MLHLFTATHDDGQSELSFPRLDICVEWRPLQDAIGHICI